MILMFTLVFNCVTYNTDDSIIKVKVTLKMLQIIPCSYFIFTILDTNVPPDEYKTHDSLLKVKVTIRGQRSNFQNFSKHYCMCLHYFVKMFCLMSKFVVFQIHSRTKRSKVKK